VIKLQATKGIQYRKQVVNALFVQSNISVQ